MPLVEKMARAICEAGHHKWPDTDGYNDRAEKEAMREMARAALKAMLSWRDEGRAPMTDWTEKQRNCRHCQGVGYVQSEMKHASGRGRAWAAQCEYCQPRTLDQIAEAAGQEARAVR